MAINRQRKGQNHRANRLQGEDAGVGSKGTWMPGWGFLNPGLWVQQDLSLSFSFRATPNSDQGLTLGSAFMDPLQCSWILMWYQDQTQVYCLQGKI